MLNELDSAPKPFGRIYTITNRVNGKKYVGQTTRDARSRWTDHAVQYKTASGRRRIPLYNAITKYGIQNFEFRVIQLCATQEELNAQEEYWITELNTLATGYNIRHGGAQNYWTDEERLRGSIRSSKHRYTVIPPSGEAFSLLSGLGLWARKIGISLHAIIRIAQYSARNPFCVRRIKGWSCCYVEDYKKVFIDNKLLDDFYGRKRKQRFVLRTPEGAELVPLESLHCFCQKNGLKAMSRVYNLAHRMHDTKECPMYNGWMCCYHEDYEQIKREGRFAAEVKTLRKYVIKTPDGTLLTPIDNLFAWCKREGFNYSGFRDRAMYHKRRSVKGYDCWTHEEFCERFMPC